LALAREEAVGLQHDYVGTEHMLLGLIRCRGSVGARALEIAGVSRQQIRKATGQAVRKGRAVGVYRELPYTSRAKKVLEFAMKWAREMHDRYVGTEHLLLGLLSEEKGIAAQILNSLGSPLAVAEKAVGTARNEEVVEGGVVDVEERPEKKDSAAWWFLEVDATSDTPIYEQIIARIEEAVATGQLEVGERLPPVRDLAAELDVAPGTVARAYSTLESRGVLETRGARGTRVAPRTESSAKSDEPGMKSDALEGLLRPVVVAAYHLGARADELKEALERAMRDIFRRDGGGRS
jgi:DNA-binding transcriptional regulator YhcF (GntR family)